MTGAAAIPGSVRQTVLRMCWTSGRIFSFIRGRSWRKCFGKRRLSQRKPAGMRKEIWKAVRLCAIMWEKDIIITGIMKNLWNFLRRLLHWRRGRSTMSIIRDFGAV